MNMRRWNKSGSVVNVSNKKYIIRMEGSGPVVTRNRRVIKPVHVDVEPDVTAEILNPSVSRDLVRRKALS